MVPVRLAQQHGGETLVGQLATFHQGLKDAHFVGLECVIRSLAVVGIGAALQQKAREAFVMGDPRRSIECAFPAGLRLVVPLIPAAIRIGAGV
jgi:hypothetical protein